MIREPTPPPTATVERLILSAGMPRSGSTWLYNAARLMLRTTVRDPAEFKSGWIRDLEREPPAPLMLVKVHAFDRALARRASCILYSYRDVRDAVASRARMTGQPQVVGEATHYVKHDRRWRRVAQYVMRYETMRADADGALRKLAETLGVSGIDLGKVRTEIDALEQPKSKAPAEHDNKNLLHSRHITHGGHGTWEGSLSTEVVSEIELRHHRWLAENGYPVPQRPLSAWDRVRRAWWGAFG